ncbi:GGDEF domain-containing protein [Alicyclobacillus macrosporangiidus]|uniref:GGDEF domain-containing protein n=1 Tax=Alicyclobacillus macrosporangiidus TaxID=392015 RepID=UPI0009DF3B1C|nr:GGDEF domain-containing protein [Alicyclobacillus macrosporangiidus]
MTEVFTRFLERLAQGMSWREAHMAFWMDLRAFGVEVHEPDGTVHERGILAGQPDWKSRFAVLDVPCSDGVYRVYFRADHCAEYSEAVRFAQAVDALLHDRERLMTEARHDALTGCLNRKGLQEWFADRVRRYTDDMGFVLVLLDFDHFKQLNDTQGHAKGDEALRVITNALNSEKRTHDILARLGGDEFVLIFEACACHPGIVQRLEGIKQRLPLKDYGLDLTMGVACYPRHGQTLEQLLARADLCLYRGKQEGRGKIVFDIDGHDTGEEGANGGGDLDGCRGCH